MKIATWNVNSLKVRLPQVLDWLQKEAPDVLCLQEIKMETEVFPREAFEALGYHAEVSGQKTYNGVATLTKQVQLHCVCDFPGWTDPQRRVLSSVVGDIRILNVYVPNGQEVGSEKYDYKLEWFRHLKNYTAALLKQHEKLVILGDFNVAPADADVHDPKKWAGHILCSDAERAALQAVMETGVKDAFRLFEQPKEIYSWWDYRTYAFVGNRGLRIDLILVSDNLATSVKKVWVDITPRSHDRPSDHAPVVMIL